MRDRVKVYATDIDEEALEQARRAVYTPREMEGLSEELVEKYFETVAAGKAFRGDLRSAARFRSDAEELGANIEVLRSLLHAEPAPIPPSQENDG